MKNRSRIAWTFLTPMLILMVLVAGWPLARSIWFSFTDTNINNIAEYSYVGFDNYFSEYGLFGLSMFSAEFWETDWGISIKNTFQFSIVSVVLETLAGLGVAMLLNQEFKGRALVRTAVLVPWAIPTIVSAKMWGWILHDQFGLINQLLVDFGFITTKIAFTADPAYALWTVVAVDVWKTTPFMALLCLAALQTLPKDCYEAARVDGVHPLRLFWKVTLPLIKHPLMVAVIFRLLDALRVFDLIFVLTSNSGSTISMSGFVRRDMVDNGNLGSGSAASTSLTLIIFLTAVLFMRAARVKLNEESN
ncbi:carbohydrate ABC transporter permease [Sphaerotilus mobilis]|uniref:Carbohydrate ABC transporter membrane protein 1 (CUT1 family) n=1 Tax=Sphaerotilus mobilis TaxID=47994 RepID=A0A4Q7LC50_9BURK|nr:sugar ABC transporter permease [Sphaerotilus mobilis]RZS51945.1 carbohydrate ABC transporter membrane protein 1 (CUT1 family) [Sphaerotilus mobilis]